MGLVRERTRRPLTNLHLRDLDDAQYLKALLQWRAGRRLYKPQRTMYGVPTLHQAKMIERFVDDLVRDLRRHAARRR